VTEPNPELDDDEFTDAALRAAVWAVLLIDLLAAVALMVTVVTLARWAA
jgi:hypothetical protein